VELLEGRKVRKEPKGLYSFGKGFARELGGPSQKKALKKDKRGDGKGRNWLEKVREGLDLATLGKR